LGQTFWQRAKKKRLMRITVICGFW